MKNSSSNESTNEENKVDRAVKNGTKVATAVLAASIVAGRSGKNPKSYTRIFLEFAIGWIFGIVLLMIFFRII